MKFKPNMTLKEVFAQETPHPTMKGTLQITRFVESKGNNELTRRCQWSGTMTKDHHNCVSFDCLNNGQLVVRQWSTMLRGVKVHYPSNTTEMAALGGIALSGLESAIATMRIS